MAKQAFSSFDYEAAFKALSIERLLPWTLPIQDLTPTDFFVERLTLLQRRFDLQRCEESKKLLIDAFCEEALEGIDYLKIWKGAPLERETAIGAVDYLIAEDRAYLQAPFICVVEAKKDDFSQGLAQCLVEMQACAWQNRQIGRVMDVFGIVSNGGVWQFYRLLVSGEVKETLPFAIAQQNSVLGALRYIFQECVGQLKIAQ
ncbi:hypothetical protein [Leptothoe kymatousa]|uniref:Type I restriction enzyme R protein N-terminal domain-containing protein n=1 Tax=Leptothoe kymatousa TAU-MAC 1615 TaxID=2364775 RepID=A0ABS5XZ40_9CYAN|nr:hypothetical protein [Leptothoe kymatousa]MBT9310879.1 hypothetical protein [Leptothoe kymatousa TAU-MAC 1615]